MSQSFVKPSLLTVVFYFCLIVAHAQSVDDILEKYYAAAGGKERLFELKSAVTRTTSYWGKYQELDSAVTEKKMLFPYYESIRTSYPDKEALTVNNDQGHFVTLKNKMTWKGEPTKECDIHPGLKLRLLHENGKLSLTRDSTLFGKDCSALTTGSGRYDDVYYFSKSDGLLIAVARPVFQHLTMFADYRTVQGIQYPFISEFFSPQNEYRKWNQVTYIEFNVPMNASDFDFDEETKMCRRKLNSPFNRIDYITDGVENLTFQQMIKKHFAGKKILIDLWATWCIPCHIDFQSFNDTFYEFLQNQNISMVFISVDKVSHKSMWEKDVDKFSLNGYHLMASPASKLNNDMKESFYQDEQFYIPRYILVNEKGEILSSTVKKPSDFQFQAQILSLLGGR
jgi:thiol-disulfide isomerase/thioredoxin